jgi:hypothetical protein
MSSGIANFQLQNLSAADASPAGASAILPRDAQKHRVIPAGVGIHLFLAGIFGTEMDSRLRGYEVVQGAW